MRHHRLNGVAVARLREAKGISQAELAGRCDITPSMLSQIENGHKQPSAPLAKVLALALGVEFEQIAEPVEAAS